MGSPPGQTSLTPPGPDDHGAEDLIEIAVAADGEAAEAISALFDRHGGGAVIEVRPGPDGRRTDATVRTYLPADDAGTRSRLEEGLWFLGRIHPIPEPVVRRLPRADWAEAWKAHYAPLRVGRHFVVAPSWTDPEVGPGDHLLSLDPGMAFGTGLHPTTQLCLRAVEDLAAPGGSVLDVGTGSGILAIGAAALGARHVVACDIDPAAAEAAVANAAANHVRVTVCRGSLAAVPAGTFHLVLGNLLAPVIEAMAPLLAQRVTPGGHLVACGILEDQGAAVGLALEAEGLALERQLAESDWVALVMGRGQQLPKGDTQGHGLS